MMHRHEKRHGRVQDIRSLSCSIARLTPQARIHERPLLWYTMKFSFCIVCNRKHWILGERIEPTVLDQEALKIPDPAMRRAYLFNKGHRTKSR